MFSFLTDELQLSQRTYSLWGQVGSRLDEYLNPLYRADAQPGLLVPNLAPAAVHFWRGLYCRFDSGVHPREVREIRLHLLIFFLGFIIFRR